MAIDFQWRVVDHCCAYCAGRILADVADEQHVRCSSCSAESGDGIRSICFCSADLGDAPIRFGCIVNPNPSAANMAEIVAGELPADYPGARRKAARR
jgi:hypothetical protein